jgi:hypothetical protein
MNSSHEFLRRLQGGFTWKSLLNTLVVRSSLWSERTRTLKKD